MKKITKSTYLSLIILAALSVSCSHNDGKDTNNDINNVDNQTEESVVESEESPKVKVTEITDYESYKDYISSIENFKPYYKIVFAFENVQGGIVNVPLEDVKNMRKDLDEKYDFISVNYSTMLSYVGDYNGSTDFVDGYDFYIQNIDNKSLINPINMPVIGYNGESYNVTPLKTVLMNEEATKNLDKYIYEGRNFKESEFILNSATDNISVVLGYGYKDLYEIGDVFELELISDIMKFEVIGFYKENSGFSMELAGEQYIDLDYSIAIPQYVPQYKPLSDEQLCQQAFLVGELTSGFVPIEEKIEDLDEKIHDKYVRELEELASKNNLTNMYKYPFWPVGFDW